MSRGKRNFFCSPKCYSIFLSKTQGKRNRNNYEKEPPLCPVCNSLLSYEQYIFGNKFCGASCSSKYNNAAINNDPKKAEEIQQKISDSMKSFIQLHGPHICSTDDQDRISDGRKKYWRNWLLSSDFNVLSPESKRNRIILEQNQKCHRCKNDVWLGEPLVLEIEHKDGNHKNNNYENLEALCPNCHSLTKTWRGRNCRKNGIRVSLTDMVNAYNEMGNMRQALIKLKLSPMGGNYKRMKSAILMQR